MLANTKILIIDDEADIRFLLKRSLSAINYSVLEAGTIKDGLEIYNANHPTIIILDVNLPDGNGLFYAKNFNDNNKNIVIMMSADNDKLSGGFKELGANGFLKKPFEINQLISIINTAQSESTSIN